MKRFFVGGLAALLPTILTLWILTALVGFVRDYIAVPVTHAIHWTLITNQAGKQVLEYCTEIEIFTPAHALLSAVPAQHDLKTALRDADRKSGFFIDLSLINRKALYADLEESIPPYIGLALSFVLIFVAGFLLRNYFVKLLFRQGERILQAFPLVRSIYKNAKKLVDFLFSGREQREFKGVVAVPYPSPGIFTVGFVTSAGLESLNAAKQEDFVSVFLPSSPTPMTGYLAFIRRSDIIRLSMSFDQAMGLIISGGAIVPDGELTEAPEEGGSRQGGQAARGTHDVDTVPAPLSPSRKPDVRLATKEEPLT